MGGMNENDGAACARRTRWAWLRWLLPALLLAVIIAFYASDIDRLFSL